MKNKALAALLLVAIVLPMQSCWLLSRNVAPPALFGPARMTWPAVADDYTRGIDDGEEDGDLNEQAADILRALGGDLGAALERESVTDVRVIPWAASMDVWARRGIVDKVEDGEIGQGVAASLSEQLSNFSETITQIKALK